MAGTQNNGFDVVYEISTDSFLDILQDLFIDNLPLRLLNLSLSVPRRLRRGPGDADRIFFSLHLLHRPVPLIITCSEWIQSQVDLYRIDFDIEPRPVSLGRSLVPGLAPTNVGNTVITLPLTIDTSTQARRSPITIGRTTDAIGVASPDNLGAAGAAVANLVTEPD